MTRAGRAAATGGYALAALGAAIGVYASGRDGDWTEVIAWLLVIVWATLTAIHERRAERWATAYVLAAGRHASAYARGYSADLASRTFDASRKDTTP